MTGEVVPSVPLVRNDFHLLRSMLNQRAAAIQLDEVRSCRIVRPWCSGWNTQ